jgi:cytochrome c oxidase assembly protein subunit 11
MADRRAENRRRSAGRGPAHTNYTTDPGATGGTREGTKEMPSSTRNIRLTALLISGVAAGMVGLSFASVPLYRMFCQATGFGGTPRTEDVARSTQVVDRRVTVRFDANVAKRLPWEFRPEQRQVTVRLGEEMLVHYSATNHSDRPVTGTASFNVVPEKAAPYFSKIACFCFTEQTLQPGEQVSMPVLFYVDPLLIEDAEANDVSTITLSYTFFRTDAEPAAAQAASHAGAQDTAKGG